MPTTLFAYGSLMILESLARGVGREVAVDELKPALLKGYRRLWRARAPIASEALERTVAGVFLDLDPAPGRYVNGLLFEATDAEMAELRLREAQYDEVDLTDRIVGAPAGSKVVTYLASESFRNEQAGLDSYIPLRYEARVHAACEAVSEAFLEEFIETTERSTLPGFEGGYTFADPEQQKRV
ncbi:MAG: gamma-glutamylcyclotransferase [Neomegalonema sp.]|nr:gamma-glutamylcyclotransferase [Neomegalonema sp.]